MEMMKDYIINDARRTSTKYGDAIVLELGDKLLYLPKRYNALDNEAIDCISRGSFSISKIPQKDDNENSPYRLQIKELLPVDAFFSSFSKY